MGFSNVEVVSDFDRVVWVNGGGEGWLEWVLERIRRELLEKVSLD